VAPTTPPRDRPHILIRKPATPERYTPHLFLPAIKSPPSPRDRKAHARELKRAIEDARKEAQARRASAGFAITGAAPGIYVQFESQPGFALKLESMESARQGIELVAVQETAGIQRATVFVPDGSIKHFVKRFEEYAEEETKSQKPKHKDFVERITALKLATLRALWTDEASVYPKPTQAIWWELWLRRHDGRELERLMEFAAHVQITVSPRRIEFPDRIVTLVHGTAEQLSASLDVLNDFAELQKAKEPASLLSKLEPLEQGVWVEELQQRTTAAPREAPAVCVLDTGVNRGHPLLANSLAVADMHACDPTWGTSDHHGHGTEMAGLALYGDLMPLLESTSPVRLRHRLESVKLLPPHDGSNPRELWGALTAEAANRVEIQAPGQRRVFSMSVASEDTRDRGQPTSWSAALDALAAGRSFEPSHQGLIYLDGDEDPPRRLFIVCAGNVDTPDINHLDRSTVEPVHDPGQAWNTLTVGAFTELVQLDPDDRGLDGWSPLAPHGELSPYSSTSVPFEAQWPLKPDLVMEGGNKACPPSRTEALQVEDLSLLTTHFRRPLTVTCATSAATAQAARLASLISAEYPGLWPETIRALLVHSAEWTPRMRGHFNAARNQRERLTLVRTYGFGVPSLERALRSATNALTLIVQDTLHPFENGGFKEMHLHALPWPREVLEDLGPAQVRLRVTLSYFIEPNPGRRGWQKRHRYASHGLRFDLKGPRESVLEFRKRLNKQALEDEEARPRGESPSEGWLLGQKRNKGSLHGDIWEGSAAELAAREVVGIYPSTGWWEEQPKRDRSTHGARYALVVSIETEQTDVDVWTPVAQEVGVPTALLVE
jgi:hypothetical protein